MRVFQHRLATWMALVLSAGFSDSLVRMSANGQASVSAPAGILTRRVWTFRPAAFARHAPEGGMGMVSRDGRYISFRDSATGNLMLHDLQTGRDRQLTTTARNDPKEYTEDSVISRDGAQIAYAWFANGGFEIRLLQLNRADAEPRVLFSNHRLASLIFPYDWSADNKWIAVHVMRDYGPPQIALISTADGSLRVLKTGADSRRAEVMTFSPTAGFSPMTLRRPTQINTTSSL
jgi:Tol biopolymer transport system component